MDSWVAYDAMGQDFADHAAGGAANAHYDRPAMLAALGNVADQDVLDAACGPGFYLEELIEGGARVRGFDGSEEMIRLARQRVGEGVEIRQAGLDQPLPYGDGSFDSVLCALAIHYAADRRATFREFFRVLRPGGRCVISTQHATTDWLRKGGSYFDVVLETDIWRVGGREQEVRYWREPLSELCSAATDAGFVIRQVIEPRPAESMRQAWPEDYAQLMQRPGFLMLDLLRLSEVGRPD
ncbi:class I SAM-dependent methyltransferase [Rhodococcus sp. WAY2]|uniref:class I SAM-dependent methyltransferase n=1 Tax=Rhodococcus sp. WAY2 TaxID=2663121 RepID=UPI001358C092|nr:class I SAM-dependent methyltransferase [Rhodococcus sp. WAY2]